MTLEKLTLSILYNFKDSPWGGGAQFLNSLKDELKRQGVYRDAPAAAEIVLLNSFPFNELPRLRQVFKLKKAGKILLHRIDGPVFRARQKDLAVDKVIYHLNQAVVDGTVFQSYWSRQENYRLGMKKGEYETVVWNAPDPIIFNSRSRKSFDPQSKIRIIASSWSTNERKGFDVYRFLDQNLDWNKYRMVFAGNSPTRFKNIKMLGVLQGVELAEELKRSDLFISASMMEACSNALIEAMHCGCVPVARNNTSHPEIVGESGVLFDGSNNILEAIERAVQNYTDLQSKISLPGLEEIARQYYAFGKRIWQDVREEKYQLKQGSLTDKYRVLGKAYAWSLKDKLRKNLSI